MAQPETACLACLPWSSLLTAHCSQPCNLLPAKPRNLRISLPPKESSSSTCLPAFSYKTPLRTQFSLTLTHQHNAFLCRLQLLVPSPPPFTAMSGFSVPLLIACCSLLIVVSAGDLSRDFDITWGDGRAMFSDDGRLLTLSLDKASGSGFESKNEYLFGKIDMQIKLVPGNSAGTVTAYYLSSQGPTHDEIDFEFLGNLSGDPYTLHTNVFTQGKGNREMQFKLWFDPTADFHTYSILWNPRHVIFMVDGTPIRDFKNLEQRGVAFPKDQPMRIYSSLWNADDWATRGGLVKADWSKAPFMASYRSFNADACFPSSSASRCATNAASATTAAASSGGNSGWWNQEVDSTGQERMKWVQKNYMIYNYCNDLKRFPQGLPLECSTA